MYSLAVKDHFMIAHSFRGEIFGPAQALHGATYAVEARFVRPELDADGLVVDIGIAATVLHEVLAALNYKNLDDVPDFAGENTTTEFLARAIHGRIAAEVAAGRFGPGAQGLSGLRVQLDESPTAWAAYEAPLG